MPRHDAVAIVERFWREVWQSRNPDAIDALVAEDFAITSGGSTIHSRAEFKRWVAGFLARIDELEFEAIETFQNTDGDRVCSRWQVTGRNNGFLGTEPDGAPVTLTGTAVLHVREDGLLQHNWVERSSHEVYLALGGGRGSAAP